MIPPWEDQYEWHRITRMTGPDYAAMCNLVNTKTHMHTLPTPLEELKAVVTEVEKSQIDDALGASWAALAAEAEPEERDIWTLLVEAGAGGG